MPPASVTGFRKQTFRWCR